VVSAQLGAPTHRPSYCRPLFWTGRNVITFPTTRSRTMSKRDLYVAKTKLKLDELNLTLDEWSNKAHEAKADVKEKYHEEVVRLREQSKQAVAKLDELKAAGEDNWESMVTSVEKVNDALIHSFNYFKSQLKG
jgi:hypothetical protein